MLDDTKVLIESYKRKMISSYSDIAIHRQNLCLREWYRTVRLEENLNTKRKIVNDKQCSHMIEWLNSQYSRVLSVGIEKNKNLYSWLKVVDK